MVSDNVMETLLLIPLFLFFYMLLMLLIIALDIPWFAYVMVLLISNAYSFSRNKLAKMKDPWFSFMMLVILLFMISHIYFFFLAFNDGFMAPALFSLFLMMFGLFGLMKQQINEKSRIYLVYSVLMNGVIILTSVWRFLFQ